MAHMGISRVQLRLHGGEDQCLLSPCVTLMGHSWFWLLPPGDDGQSRRTAGLVSQSASSGTPVCLLIPPNFLGVGVWAELGFLCVFCLGVAHARWQMSLLRR